ncbi:esterase lipase [Pediococcus argentinicus]|uniref:Esterase lipase n=1 Tax=Pediococcus argentinicus TaxID=480391 RepID=A0A0R2NFQ7_9LACO|nr:esterase lipase [Pediococcus argentinicus]
MPYWLKQTPYRFVEIDYIIYAELIWKVIVVKVNETKDVLFSSENDLKLDIYDDGSDDNKRAAIIDIHGGGWFRGDKGKDEDLGETLAELGYLVLIPNYRITPQGYYPDPIDDIADVIEWLKNSNLKFDRNRIGLLGSSAGGNLAVEASMRYGLPAASWSGIFDIEDWLADHQDVVGEQNTDIKPNTPSNKIDQDGKNDPFYKWFIMNYLQDESKAYDATPVHRVTDKVGPLFLANSLNEFVPNSGVMELEQKLIDLQIPVETKFLTGGRHAKGYMDDVLPATLAFFDQYL